MRCGLPILCLCDVKPNKSHKNTAIIALGSNIDPERHFALAKARLREKVKILAESSAVYTKPIGSKDQPDFLNGVILIETEMKKSELVRWLHSIEDALGRIRSQDKYGPRTIDLDLVVWQGQVVHSDVKERSYLQELIQEISPQVQFYK